MTKHIFSFINAQRFSTDTLYRNSVYFILNSVVGASGGFLFWMVCARFFPPSEVGLSNGIIAAVSLVALLSRFGLDVAIVRFSSRPNDQFCATVGVSTITIAIGSILISIAFVAGSHLWGGELFRNFSAFSFFLAFVIFAVVFALSYFVESVIVGMRQAGYVLAIGIIVLATKLSMIPVTSFLHCEFRPYYSWGIALAVGLLVSILFILPRIQIRPTLCRPILGPFRGGFLAFGAASYATQLATILPNQILPLIVLAYLGSSQTAFFFIPWTISGLIWVIPTSFSRSLFAESSYKESSVYENSRKSLRWSFPIVGAIVILGVPLGRPFLSFFGADYGANSYDLLVLLLISAFPLVISSTYIVVLQIKKRLAEFVAMGSISSLTFLLLVVLTIDKFGIASIGYSWLAVQLCLSAYCLLKLQPELR